MNQQWSNGGWSAGLPQWRRAYTQLPGKTGCFSRCQPRCGLVPPPQQQQLPQQPQRPGLPPPPPQVKRKQNNLFGEMLKLFLDPPCVRLPHVLPQLLQCATFLWTLGPAAVGGKHGATRNSVDVVDVVDVVDANGFVWVIYRRRTTVLSTPHHRSVNAVSWTLTAAYKKGASR